MQIRLNPLKANPIKWSNTLKQFAGKLPTNRLSVFGHFVNLVLKRLKIATLLKKLFKQVDWVKGEKCSKCFIIVRNSRPDDVFCKKGFLKHFAKFTGKHLGTGVFL